MPINYGAIPTVWRGIQMRSRLEARVAEFLTMHNLVFDYEPIELAGHYIPDYLVEFEFGVCLLEVKPAVTPMEFRPACKRITRSGWEGPALVLGPRLTMLEDGRSDLTLYGTTHAEKGRWSRVGGGRWPASWGDYPFDLIQTRWAVAGNMVQYKRESVQEQLNKHNLRVSGPEDQANPVCGKDRNWNESPKEPPED